MVTTLRPFRAGNGKLIRQSTHALYGKNVSAPVTAFLNGSSRRMPFAISRDLQPSVVAGKELYFRVQHNDLRTVANGGLVQTSHDFQFETLTGTIVPYIISTYDAVTGTLFGVLKMDLAGSTTFTRGWFYFNNTAWGTSREDAANTFPGGAAVLFLPSGVDRDGTPVNFNASLPTSDVTLVNPGAKLNGSTDYIWRAATGSITTFTFAFQCRSLEIGDDNAVWAYGLEGGNTVLVIRHLNGAANGPTGGEARAWRMTFTTTSGTSYYETATDSYTEGTLQHVAVTRNATGHPQIYFNGVLKPWAFISTPLTANAADSGAINLAGQRLLLGRGSVTTRFFNGYLDCFKVFTTAKPAGWAAAEFSNISDIDAAVIFGTPESPSTTSVFGEAIKITCDGNANVSFLSDKYSLSDGGPISVAGFTQPAGGVLSSLTGNNVSYQNNSNIDPDNAGKVSLTNGVGGVIIPVRAHIVVVTPPPPGGFYKIPNHLVLGKTPVNCANRTQLNQAFTDFASGALSTVNRYINLTADIGTRTTTGADINITAGGTATHPLVITCTNGDKNDTLWSSRPIIYNSCLHITKPWVWLFGLYMEMLPTGVGVWRTPGIDRQVAISADNSYITACRFATSRCIHNSTLPRPDKCTANFNWFEIAAQSTTSVGGGDNGIYFEGSPDTVTNLTAVRNRFTDHPLSLTGTSSNFRCFLMGDGKKGTPSFYSTNTEIAYNFMDCSYSHCMEFKVYLKSVHHNHGTYAGGTPSGARPHGPNTRGDNANADTAATRPAMYANRILCAEWEMNGRNWDYANNWLVNAGGTIVGDFILTPFGLHTPAAKNIGGSDGARMIANKANLVLGDVTFEPANYAYENLGSRDKVLIAGHIAGSIQNNAGHVATWAAGYPPGPALLTGSNNHVINSQISRQDALVGGYALETPPTLNATLCGPAASGKVWGT